MHMYSLFNILAIFELFFGIFWFSLSLSLSLSYVCVSLCLWHLNASLLHPKTFFFLGNPLPLILLHHIFSSMMRMPVRLSWRTFLNEAFILNAKSSWRTLLTLIYPMSFIVRVGSHCMMSQSHVHPCWSKSFTPTCMDLILQYLSFILAFEVCTLLSHQSWYPMCSVPLG